MLPLFRRPPKSTIAALYGAIVAQARLPVFYQSLGVPDTVLGRFDMIVLHLVLLLRRLREGQAHRELAQAVFNAFCRDMDDNLREMGISDQGVPREMRKVGEAFYGRAQAYEAALGAPGDAGLAAALARNVYGAVEPPVAAASLAAYVRAAARVLAEQELTVLASGHVHFPAPDRPDLVAAE
jgi:cytochrome b pre-mRNA-processing protein 3